MTRRICVVTGTRAEFGLLRWIMADLAACDDVTLQVVATGMHLSPEFGGTVREIEEAGFAIDERVEMLLSSDTAVGITKSIGLGLIGFADAFARLDPDIILLLGDRYEIFAAASAALVLGVPIAHLNGGETTQGAFDEAFRHSITKMAHLHFVAADEYRRRVIQLGEQPSTVHLVGGTGVDAIHRAPLMTREELEQSLDFQFGDRNLLVTFHPVTLDPGSQKAQFEALLDALADLPDIRLIFTMPNADTGGRELAAMVDGFVAGRPYAKAFTSLGQRRYFSTLKVVDGVVGNSSSGLAEAPSFNIGTINIGDRQEGRLKASSVIDCAPERAAIAEALDRLYSTEFRNILANARNPYGDGGASARVVHVLRHADLTGINKKRFHDIAQ